MGSRQPEYKIIVDARERKLFEVLKDKCLYDYEIDTITVGDFVIMLNGKIIYVIERKTWKDLASSIKDGRIDNYKKLIDLRSETGCKVIILIEGNAFPSPRGKVGGISAKALVSHLDHVATRDHFMVIQTRNKEHSIERICALITSHKTIKWNKFDKYSDIPTFVGTRYCADIKYYMNMLKQTISEFNEFIGGGISTGGAELLHKKYTKSDELVQIKMMQCIPKISLAMASNIHQKYSIKDLLNSGFEEGAIALFRHPSGSLYGEIVEKYIKTIAKKSNEIVCEDNKYPKTKAINRDVRVQILSQINGVSEKIALKILEVVPISKITSETLEGLVGKKLSSNIIRILS